MKTDSVRDVPPIAADRHPNGDRIMAVSDNRRRIPKKTVTPPISAQKLRIRAVLSLMIVDAIAIISSFALFNWLRQGQSSQNAILFAVAVMCIYLVIASNQHAYSSEALRSPIVATRRGIVSVLIALATAVLAAYFTKTSTVFPRLTVGAGAVITVIEMSLLRYWLVANLSRVIGGNPFQTLVIVDGDVKVPNWDFDYVEISDSELDPEANHPRMYLRMAQSLGGADRVLVACAPERRMAWAKALKGANVQGEMYVPELAHLMPSGMVNEYGSPAIIVANGPLSLFDRATKRAFDIATASMMVLALSPLLIVIAILIKLDSPGPVLFRQERFGRGNRMFDILKFRSMRHDQCDSTASQLTTRNDARVTRIGNFIRRTSIDELPQLFNVLRGDMSIVGPRPHAAGAKAASKLYWEVDDRYWHRHSAKPGLTGLAQVRGYRGNTEMEVDLTNRLQADLEYLRGWTIWRDLRILLMTARVVLHENAF